MVKFAIPDSIYKILLKLNNVIYNFLTTLLFKINEFLDFPINPGIKVEYNPDFAFRGLVDRFTRDIEKIENQTLVLMPRVFDLEEIVNGTTPKNYLEVVFGTLPHIQPEQIVYFVDKERGYYNFYVEEHWDLVYLSNVFSEFVQMTFNLHTDYTYAAMAREIFFTLVFLYRELYGFRMVLGFLLFINPYRLPWALLIAYTDWLEEIVHNIMESTEPLDLPYMLMNFLIGSSLDWANFLVFTFPFLPKEREKYWLINGDKGKTFINLFSGFPDLWVKHGVPNEIREQWYYGYPEVLKFMQEAYGDLGLKFLPDEILEQLDKLGQLDQAHIQAHIDKLSVSHFFNHFYVLEYFSHLFDSFF